jgi:hypothetical protein
LLSFSAAAWKCAARDAWIGWDFRHPYDRLHLIANHSRFLILPDQHYPNLASRVLALSERRLVRDWPERFGYPVLLLESFVDPQRFHGTIYRAANWRYVGDTRGLAQDLSQQARARFRCRYRDRRYRVPSRTVLREALTRVDPQALSDALHRWNRQHADDEALAIDGNTMCQAIGADGQQTHVLGVVGHQSQTSYTQKKSVPCP